MVSGSENDLQTVVFHRSLLVYRRVIDICCIDTIMLNKHTLW